jgi:hypothetical protein
MAEEIRRGDARGTLALCRVGDSRKEGFQPSLLVTSRQRDTVSEHRGLSSGVASGKSAGSRYAYGWVETSTLSTVAHTSSVISDKCFTYCVLKFIY